MKKMSICCVIISKYSALKNNSVFANVYMVIKMKTLNEFCEFISELNPISKTILKGTTAIVFILLMLAMYFALSAGRTEEYYISMYYFEALIENVKSILGLGCFFAILFAPVSKNFTVN